MELAQLRGVTHAGQHEELRAVDRARREDHFAGCPHAFGAIAGDEFHAARAIAVEDDLGDVGVQEKSEVGTIEIGAQEGTGRAYAGASRAYACLCRDCYCFERPSAPALERSARQVAKIGACGILLVLSQSPDRMPV